MNVPSYVARIEAKFGPELEELNEKINHGLLYGCFTENRRGYQVIHVVLDKYPDQELQRYVADQYKKEKWDLEFLQDYDVDDDGQFWVEVHKIV